MTDSVFAKILAEFEALQEADRLRYEERRRNAGLDPRPAQRQKRPVLYGVSWRLLHWPMTLFGWVAPKTGARLATRWMHFCGFALDGHVEAVNRRCYHLVRDSGSAYTVTEWAMDVRVGRG